RSPMQRLRCAADGSTPCADRSSRSTAASSFPTICCACSVSANAGGCEMSDSHSQDYKKYTMDMFMFSFGRELEEMAAFDEWKQAACRDHIYPFENTRWGAQRSL